MKVLALFLVLSLSVLAQEKLTPDKRMVRAVQYPYEMKVKFNLYSTGRAEGVDGKAEVKRHKGGIDVEVEIDQAPAASQIDPSYKGYVVWALTTAGKFVNLGSIERTGTLKATTKLPAFAIVISAEPDLKAATLTDAVLESAYPEGKRRIYPMHQVIYSPRAPK